MIVGVLTGFWPYDPRTDSHTYSESHRCIVIRFTAWRKPACKAYMDNINYKVRGGKAWTTHCTKAYLASYLTPTRSHHALLSRVGTNALAAHPTSMTKITGVVESSDLGIETTDTVHCEPRTVIQVNLRPQTIRHGVHLGK
jgi:hypothetical protein